MEESKILSVIANLSDVARKEKWQTQYNRALDAFYWTKPDLSKDAELTQFIDEFSFYLRPTGDIEGVFIEYALHNFVEHHEEFRPLFESMTENVEGTLYTIPDQAGDEKIDHLLEGIADKVAKETLGVVAKGFRVEDFLAAN